MIGVTLIIPALFRTPSCYHVDFSRTDVENTYCAEVGGKKAKHERHVF